MIKKSLRAYISRSHLEFPVLLHSEVVRFLFLQLLKEDIHRALVGLVIFPGFTGVDQVQEGNEVAFFLRSLIPDVADQGRIVQPLSL